MTKPRKYHFGAQIAERMAKAQDPVPPEEMSEPSRRWSFWEFHRELEKRVKDNEAGD